MHILVTSYKACPQKDMAQLQATTTDPMQGRSNPAMIWTWFFFTATTPSSHQTIAWWTCICVLVCVCVMQGRTPHYVAREHMCPQNLRTPNVHWGLGLTHAIDAQGNITFNSHIAYHLGIRILLYFRENSSTKQWRSTCSPGFNPERIVHLKYVIGDVKCSLEG